jgi:hypothetical protein
MVSQEEKWSTPKFNLTAIASCMEAVSLHLRQANKFVTEHHRHNLPTVGGCRTPFPGSPASSARTG